MPSLKRFLDALALEGMGRHQLEVDGSFTRDWTQIIQRFSQPIDHAAFEAFANRNLKRSPKGDYFAAGVDAMHLPKGHEQNVVIAETNHFSQGGTIMPGGFNAADFTHRG